MNTKINPSEITAILKQELANFEQHISLEEVGTVLQVNDGIVKIYGLTDVQAGELIRFENDIEALVLNLEDELVGAVILAETSQIREGDKVKRTRKIASILVGEGMIGRVINTLGEPIDGKGAIQGALFDMPLERKAPGIIYREPVKEPLQTGVKAIDAMIPIGRGQRELIVGDRQIGKTTIAIDTILNQRHCFEQGKPVYCIYVAIGQKASSVAQVVDVLEKNGAMEYTTIISSPASSPASLQYLAPFAGTSLGEFLRDTGHDALIVYDDLSKHAVAYREISLLLRRPPGREAFSGDVFYLHSRLLERAGKINSTEKIAKQMNDVPPSIQKLVQGGGSLTALPIIETQAGDVSAYIPTNVISITDGQIFLETNLFHADLRPAINVGISVSRVGGAAQTKGMKKLANTLKISQAQFVELEAFAKFGSSLDDSTKQIIQRGRINQKLFTQPPHQPVKLGFQIALIYVAVEGYLDALPLRHVKHFEQNFSARLLEEENNLLIQLDAGILQEDAKKKLEKIAIEIVKKFI